MRETDFPKVWNYRADVEETERFFRGLGFGPHSNISNKSLPHLKSTKWDSNP